jgi:hypothetical protein
MSDEIEREIDETATEERALQKERDRLAELGRQIDEEGKEVEPAPVVIDHTTQGGVI